MSQPSLYLTLLHRNLGEGHSWVEASDRALAGVAHAYDLVKQAVIGPPALRSNDTSEQPPPPTDVEVADGEVDDFLVDEVEFDEDIVDAETVDDDTAAHRFGSWTR